MENRVNADKITWIRIQRPRNICFNLDSLKQLKNLFILFKIKHKSFYSNIWKGVKHDANHSFQRFFLELLIIFFLYVNSSIIFLLTTPDDSSFDIKIIRQKIPEHALSPFHNMPTINSLRTLAHGR